MPAPDLQAPMLAILSLLEGTSGIQAAGIGTPLALTNRVSAFVDFLGLVQTDVLAGLRQTTATYYVAIGHRVQGAEETAALGLAAAVPAFIEQFMTVGDPRRSLNGTCTEARLEADVGTAPLYVTFAGQEFKLVPLRITAIIRHI